jgi:hypothetical protein
LANCGLQESDLITGRSPLSTEGIPFEYGAEASFSEDGNVIYCTRYEPGNLSTGDLYVVQKVDGVWQPARNWNDVPELPHINMPTNEEHCPIIASDSLIYFSYQQPGVTQDSDIWKVEKKMACGSSQRVLGRASIPPIATISIGRACQKTARLSSPPALAPTWGGGGARGVDLLSESPW